MLVKAKSEQGSINEKDPNSYVEAEDGAQVGTGGVQEIFIEEKAIYVKQKGESAIDAKNPDTYAEVEKENAFKKKQTPVVDEKAARTPIERHFNYSSARVAGRLFSAVSGHEPKDPGDERPRQ